MKHARKNNKAKALIITLSSFFGLLLIAYGLGVWFFWSHFTFFTTIDNEDCSFMSAQEVEGVISDHVDAFELQMAGRDDLDETITAQDVGLYYVPDGQVGALLEQQNAFLWFVPVFGRHANETTKVSVDYAASKLDAKYEAMDLYSKDKMRPPKDAYAEFQNTQYVVHPEDLGSTLIEERVQNAVDDALLSMDPELDLDHEGCYLSPKIFANNPDLKEEIDLWNTYACFEVIYTFGKKTEVLNGSITMDWINIDEGGSGSLNDEAVEAWVRGFAKKHDTVGTTRKFKTATGEDAKVEGGTYGWEIDEEAEVAALIKAYKNHTGETREPKYVQKAVKYAKAGQPEWGTTYLELDLTKQHIYYVKKGKIEFEADVVTGSPWGGRATPQGVYSILEMRSPAKLVGEIQSNGKPEYETWVTYWMRMTWAGHGFHDATWQPWFGGDRYTYAGSHGCINMDYYDAEKLYSLIHEGLPVVSHY